MQVCHFSVLRACALVVSKFFINIMRPNYLNLFTAGYKLNYHVLNALVLRYGKSGMPYVILAIVSHALRSTNFQQSIMSSHVVGNRQGTIGFDDFIMCAIKLKNIIGNGFSIYSLSWTYTCHYSHNNFIILTEAFKQRDPYNTKRATFTLDEFIDKTLYS